MKDKPNFPTCHSHPQSLDSGSTPEAFLEREIELGTGTITCTDHGTLAACRKIYDLTKDKKACGGQVVTPIMGCLLPGQEIHTIDGMKNVQDIKVGDLVLTHKGRFRKVRQVMTRMVDENVYVLQIARKGSRKIKLTSEHPLLVSTFNKKEPQWTNVSNILTGRPSDKLGIDQWLSYVHVPKLIGEGTGIVDVASYLPSQFFDDNGTISKTPAGISGQFGSFGYEWKSIPSSMYIDDDFAFFLGLFCAEGSTDSKDSGIATITLNKNEADLALICSKFLSKLGISLSQKIRKDKGSLDMRFCCRPFVLVLSKMVGQGSHNKKVPAEILEHPSKHVRLKFLDGLLAGDGAKRGDYLKLSSQKAIWGVKALISDLGAWAEPKVVNGSLNGKANKAWSIQSPRNAKWRRSIETDRTIAIPVRSIITEKYVGPVFNFSVEEDESYVSDIAMHNCEGYLRDDNCSILAANGYQKNATGAFIGAPKYMHFCVHFMDQAAYECGVRLLSRADERLEGVLAKLEAKDRRHGKERKPLLTWDDLEELGGYNVTMTSGCLIGVVQRHLLDNNDAKTAEAYLQRMISINKPGNMYVELNPHDCSKEWVNGVFITPVAGEQLKFYKEKTLMTNVGEIKAGDLAKSWSGGKHLVLKSIKDHNAWREMEEIPLSKVEYIEDYMQHECKPWAEDGDLQKGLNRVMKHWAKKHKLPILIGDDSHYATPAQQVVQDVRLSQAGGNWRFYKSYHRLSSDEAFEHFNRTLGTSESEFDGWVDNAYAWKERFKDFKFTSEVSLPTKFYEPSYCDHPWHQNPSIKKEDYTVLYTMELIKKHGRMDWKNPVYVKRLQEEIKLFHKNGKIDLLPYFWIGEEVCSLYNKYRLLTGPGRGSSAGCIIAYLLGITHIDPIICELSLDRFLTLDRIRSGKLPDIDMDFCDRDLINNPETGWLKTRFGDHAAQLSVDITLKVKSAMRDVARMLHNTGSAGDKQIWANIEQWTRKLLMPPMGISDIDFVMGYEKDDGDIVKGSSELGHSGSDPVLIEYINRYPKDWEVVKQCLGLARGRGRHACSVVIANRPIGDFIPMTTVSDVRVTSYTAASVEAVGGLKMDFLTVNSLMDINDCIKLIQSRSTVEIPKEATLNNKKVPGYRIVPINGQMYDIWDIPEDRLVYEDVATSKSETVFQFGTPGAQKWMKHFSQKRQDGTYPINSLMDLATFTALDRPGPLDMFVTNPDSDGKSKHNMLVEYARRSLGETPSSDIPSIMDELVPETLGVLCFQESLQRAYQQLTGCTGSEAEEFRSNVAKKKKEKVDAAKVFFIPRATEKVGAENAEAIWKSLETFGQYGFNKSHAVCYSAIGYACAYLKHYFPLEWWTSVLKNANKNEISDKFWRFCGHLVDLPDIAQSGDVFEIRGDRIRAPLSLIHGIGDAAHGQINRLKPYADLEDFVMRHEKFRYDTGTLVTKNKKVKIKVDDPSGAMNKNGTPKKVSVDSEASVTTLKLGYSALNRGTINTLFLSSAFDSFFPSDTLLVDKMETYEKILAKVKTDLGPIQTTGKWKGQRKPVKVGVVDEKYREVRQIAQYQMRKSVLAAYAEDLTKLLIDTKVPCVAQRTKDGRTFGVFIWCPPFSNSTQTTLLGRYADFEYYSQDIYMEPGERIYLAMPGYVLEHKVFQYDSGNKTACKILLDIEGARVEVVRWPNKEGEIDDKFRQDLVGSIIVACVSKYKSDKPFALDDITVIEPPLGSKEEPEEVEEAVEEEADGSL